MNPLKNAALLSLKKWRVPVDPILSIETRSPVTHNVVGDAYLNVICILPRVVGATGNGCFRKPRLSAVTIRLDNGLLPIQRAPTIQLFESGKLVVMGASSIAAIIFYVHKFLYFLYLKGWRTSDGKRPQSSHVFITNRVSSGSHRTFLDIDNWQKNDTLNTIVHRASFSGIGVRVDLPGCRHKLTFGIFDTGKFNVTGYDNSIHCYLIWLMLNVFRQNENTVRVIDRPNRFMNMLRDDLHRRKCEVPSRDEVCDYVRSIEKIVDDEIAEEKRLESKRKELIIDLFSDKKNED